MKKPQIGPSSDNLHTLAENLRTPKTDPSAEGLFSFCKKLARNRWAWQSLVTMSKPLLVSTSISPSEVSKHNTPEDAWITIDGGVYDITHFGRRHPGGSLIYQFAGMDATDAFHAFHYDSGAEKRLGGLKVGEISSTPPPLLQEFRALRKNAEQCGLMKPSFFNLFKCSLVFLTLYVVGHSLFWLLPLSFASVVLCGTSFSHQTHSDYYIRYIFCMKFELQP